MQQQSWIEKTIGCCSDKSSKRARDLHLLKKLKTALKEVSAETGGVGFARQNVTSVLVCANCVILVFHCGFLTVALVMFVRSVIILFFSCSGWLKINHYHCIDRRIYLNLSRSTQSAAGLNSLKPAANGRYFMCKSLPYYLHLLYRSTFILLSEKCMLGLFLLMR